jgi:hypothetical protein
VLWKSLVLCQSKFSRLSGSIRMHEISFGMSLLVHQRAFGFFTIRSMEAMGNIWPSNVLLRWGQLLSYRHPRLQLGLFLIADKVLSNTPVSHVVAQEAKQLAVIIHL